MNLAECYNALHGDYAQAKRRMMNDTLVERFVLKFKDEDLIGRLRKGIADNDIEETFNAVHALKGVAGNLAFVELAQAASDLTEQIRSRKESPDTALIQRVEDSYKLVIDTITQYENQ